ncbi:MAG: hypothetical protein ACOYBH_07945 [Candidatus Alectryocaccobium sp.]|jgi:hypothetical protein
MPYIKQPKRPFGKMRELIMAKEFRSPRLAAVLCCSQPTAKKKMDNPELLTLGDLDKLNRFGHIPIEEIREAIVR